jgi:hypothetical protein
MSRTWFSYTGPVGGELNSLNYIVSSSKPTCLQGSPNICSVYAIYSPENYYNHPKPFSANLILYIANLKITGAAQPVGSKKYVYSYPL